MVATGAVSVVLALCLLMTTLLCLELGISKPRLGDSVSVGSVVDEDKGVKLVHVPRLGIRTTI